MDTLTLPANDPRWLSYIATNQNAVIFHHPTWLNAVANSYGYKPFVLAILDEQGCVVAGLPLMDVHSALTGRRIVGLPFTDFCPPLASDPRYMDMLVAGLANLRNERRIPRLEVRWQLPEQPGIRSAGTVAWHITHLEPDPQRVLAHFKRTAVQKIRQAEKAGLTSELSTEWPAIEDFYRLHVETRRRLGVPVQPRRYFRALWDQVIRAGLGFVLIVRFEGKPISAAVFMHWQKTMVYKYSASDSEQWALRPNNLMIWQAMEWACEHGYEFFDWGRSDMEDEGLRSFKRHMAGEERIMNYSVFADAPLRVKTTSGQSRQILARVIQKSPTWVCRALGESLYAHFG